MIKEEFFENPTENGPFQEPQVSLIESKNYAHFLEYESGQEGYIEEAVYVDDTNEKKPNLAENGRFKCDNCSQTFKEKKKIRLWK